MRDLGCRRDVHRGRECVVRRLAHVDVIVRMHRRFLAALAAEHLVGAVRDHLVQVHVGLRAGAGLPHDQRKVAVELAVDHLLRGRRDRARALRVENAERPVHLRRRALDQRHRADQRLRHALLADAEILQRALRLRAPVAVGGDLDRAEGVGFGAGFRHDVSWLSPYNRERERTGSRAWRRIAIPPARRGRSPLSRKSSFLPEPVRAARPRRRRTACPGSPSGVGDQRGLGRSGLRRLGPSRPALRLA